MENIIAELLKDFEQGKMSRRQLIQSLALVAAAAVPGTSASAAPSGKGFKAFSLDHISYQVADYKRTRDFYADLMGMTPSRDNGASGCDLNFGGNQRLVVRNHPKESGPNPKPTVDHVAYWIDDWDTDKVKAELERRGLSPSLDGGGYASFNMKDLDGFGLQISGLVKPGDSLYGEKLKEFRK